jgi:hypothetical protein
LSSPPLRPKALLILPQGNAPRHGALDGSSFDSILFPLLVLEKSPAGLALPLRAKGPSHSSLGRSPRPRAQTPRRAESPSHRRLPGSIPDVGLIVLYPVLFEKHSEFLLKCSPAMVVFLVVDIGPQPVQVGGESGFQIVFFGLLPGPLAQAGIGRAVGAGI